MCLTAKCKVRLVCASFRVPVLNNKPVLHMNQYLTTNQYCT